MYSENKYCTASRGFGNGWSRSWGTFADYATGGKDASQACCACGGGEASDPCAGVVCRNGGTCDAGACTCGAGFSGANCETATATPSVTALPTITALPTATAVPTATATPIPTPSPSPTQSEPAAADLAVEIVADDEAFMWWGAAWWAPSAVQYPSGNRLTEAYFQTPAAAVRLEMNGRSRRFELEDAQKGRTLAQIMSGAPSEVYPCVGAPRDMHAAARSKASGLDVTSNPWAVPRSWAEDKLCAVGGGLHLLFHARRLTSRAVQVGFFRDQADCCNSPATTEGIGLARVASGADGHHHGAVFYPAALFVVPWHAGVPSPSPGQPRCYDGVKNGREEGVDCGGPCRACQCNSADAAHLPKLVACGEDTGCWIMRVSQHLSGPCVTCLMQTEDMYYCYRLPLRSGCTSEEAALIEGLQACRHWHCRAQAAAPLQPECAWCLALREFHPHLCLPATCTDGRKNGDEVDVDCGGSCAACRCRDEDMAHLQRAIACGGAPDCYTRRVAPFLSADCARCAPVPSAFAACLPAAAAAADRGPLLELLACGSDALCAEPRAADLTGPCQRCLVAHPTAPTTCLPAEACPDGRPPPCDGPAPHAIGRQCTQTTSAVGARSLQECLALAAEDPACPGYVMWAPRAPVPGPGPCRCCAWGAQTGGSADAAWSIYQHPVGSPEVSHWQAMGAARGWRYQPPGPVATAPPLPRPAAGGSYWRVDAPGRGGDPATAVLQSAASPSGAYAAVSFRFRVSGPDIASLAVEAASANGTWARAWGGPGPRRTSGAAPWAAVSVAFPDGALRVLFVAVVDGPSGAAALADVALRVAHPAGSWAPSPQRPGWRLWGPGATPTPGTGPAGGPGAGPYWYAEASGAPAGRPADLLSPVAARGYAGLAFAYHMYGADAGALEVATRGPGGGWARVWGRAGPQQPSADAAWQEVVLPLPGAPAQVRLRAVAGAGARGDVAVAGLRAVYANAVAVTAGAYVSVPRAECEALSTFRGVRAGGGASPGAATTGPAPPPRATTGTPGTTAPPRARPRASACAPPGPRRTWCSTAASRAGPAAPCSPPRNVRPPPRGSGCQGPCTSTPRRARPGAAACATPPARGGACRSTRTRRPRTRRRRGPRRSAAAPRASPRTSSTTAQGTCTTASGAGSTPPPRTSARSAARWCPPAPTSAGMVPMQTAMASSRPIATKATLMVDASYTTTTSTERGAAARRPPGTFGWLTRRLEAAAGGSYTHSTSGLTPPRSSTRNLCPASVAV